MMRKQLMVGLLLSVVLMVGCARSDQPDMKKSPPASPAVTPPTESGSTPPVVQDKSGCAGSTIAHNLQVAADAKLPVPTTLITTRILPAPTVQQFTDETHVAPEIDAIRRDQFQRSWMFHADGRQVTVRIEVLSTTGELNAPVLRYLYYVFPSGDLKQGADLTDMVAQLQRSLSKLQVSATRVEVEMPRPGPTIYELGSGPLNLKPLVTEYQASAAQFCSRWSRQRVPAWSTGTVIMLPVDILDLRNGVGVGFLGKAFVTQSTSSGTTVTTWYEIPGLEVIPWSPSP